MDTLRLGPSKKPAPAPSSKSSKSSTGSSLSILLLLVPLVAGVWAARQPAHAAINGEQALFVGVGLSVTAYALLWVPSFWRTNKDRALAAVSVFLLLLWVIVGVLVTARLNTALDDGATEPLEAVVVSANRSGKHCRLDLRSPQEPSRLEHAIAAVTLDASYCEIVDAGDTYVADLHPGALGLRWPGPPTIRKRRAGP